MLPLRPSRNKILMLAVPSLCISAFHLCTTTRKIGIPVSRLTGQRLQSYQPSHTKRSSSMKGIDFSGLSDNLVNRLARDLNLFPFRKRSAADISIATTRELLTDFVGSHPEAEKLASHLILQYLRIDKSLFASRRGSRVASEIEAAPLAESDGPSKSFDCSDDILPNFSPIPWLTDQSWLSMSCAEKLNFMDHVTDGKFKSNDIIPSHDRSKFFPTVPLFRNSTIDFGIGGMDRVVLGNGSRRVLVLVGIHGNEPCGVTAVNVMLQKKSLFLGNASVTARDLDRSDNWKQPIDSLFDSVTVEFLVGNPAALENNTRFLVKNLNRLFDCQTLCNDLSAEKEGYRYELQRARLIAESIRDADFVLDIHSTSADVGSFALPSSMELSEEVAEYLPVKYVVQSLAHMTLEGGTTLDCALLHNVPAICVECGQHSHPDVVSRAAAVISTFLAIQKSEEEVVSSLLEQGKPTVMKCQYAERVSHGFEWLNQFPEFHFVPENTPVFRDSDRGDVFAPSGGAYIVMPTSIPMIGEEALFWASAK